MRAIDENALLEEINELPFTMSIYANSNDCRTARETKERIVAVIREAPTISPDEVRGVGCPVCQCKDPLPEDGMTHEFYIRGTMLWYYDQLFGWEGTKINYYPSCGEKIEEVN